MDIWLEKLNIAVLAGGVLDLGFIIIIIGYRFLYIYHVHIAHQIQCSSSLQGCDHKHIGQEEATATSQHTWIGTACPKSHNRHPAVMQFLATVCLYRRWFVKLENKKRRLARERECWAGHLNSWLEIGRGCRNKRDCTICNVKFIFWILPQAIFLNGPPQITRLEAQMSRTYSILTCTCSYRQPCNHSGTTSIAATAMCTH